MDMRNSTGMVSCGMVSWWRQWLPLPTGNRRYTRSFRLFLLFSGLAAGLGSPAWGQSPETLERSVLSNRSLLGRPDAASPSAASPSPVVSGTGRSPGARPGFRFTPRAAPPAMPANLPAAPTAAPTVAPPPASPSAASPSAWVSAGEGTPWNPFRLKPVMPPPMVEAASGGSLPGLLRQSERRYWQLRATTVAQQERVPAWLFLRLIRQESGFNPRARSPVGAIGLTQLMPDTARSLGVNPHDPEQNLRGGARYLRQMLHRFRGHIPSALASYNAGPVAVEAYQRGETRRVGNKVINAGRRVLPIPPYRETRHYVASILGGVPGVPVMASIPPPVAAPQPVMESAPPPGLRRTGRIYLAEGGASLGEVAAPENGNDPGAARRSLRPGYAGGDTGAERQFPADVPSEAPAAVPSLSPSAVSPSAVGDNVPATGDAPAETFSPKAPGMVRSLPNRSIYIVQPGGRP